MITHENWTFCEYLAENFRANISFGGEYGKNNEYLEIFYENKFENDVIFFQKAHSSLQEAINSINKTHGHWNFEDKSIKDQSSGCSTCQAH